MITTPSSSTPSVTAAPSPTPPPLQPSLTLNSSLLQCYKSWNAHALEWSWANEHRTPVTIPYMTKWKTSLYWPPNASFTTLCDGIPRAVDPPVPTTSISWVVMDYNTQQTLSEMPPISNPSVDCHFCDRCNDCNALSQYISTESSKWSEQPEPRTPSTLSLRLPCAEGTPTPYGPTTPLAFPTAPNSPSCIIEPVGQPFTSTATLFHWPVTTVSGDFCKQDGTTITPTQTISGKDNMAVYNGMTMTSPTAVLIIDAVSAVVEYRSNNRNHWTYFGSVHTAATFSIHPTALSSVNNFGVRLRVGSPLKSYSFNFADLNTVPYPTYSSVYCKRATDNCSMIWDEYAPKVGVPPELTALRSEWKYCTAWGSVRPMVVPVTGGVTTTVTRTKSAVSSKKTDEGGEVVE